MILNAIFKPIHREGWPIIGIFAVVTFILLLISNTLGMIGAILTVWCVYFFRDPERVTPKGEGLVISPADGVVQSIGEHIPPEELEMGSEPMTRIAVFMNVFDVHVNRIPIKGRIEKIWYYPGKFMNASFDKASEFNERQAFKLYNQEANQRIAFVQIAGLIARRIVCDVNEGQELNTADRFGIIRFGSRVDVYLPRDTAINVQVGQTMIAGETVLGTLKKAEPKRLANADTKNEK